jgi:inner membrane transporter RhtA
VRDLPAPLVWLAATTANVTAAAFNSRIDADPIAIAWMRMVVATAALALLARGFRRVGWNRSLVLMGVAIAGMNAAFYVALPRIGLGLTVALGLVGPIALAAVLGRTRRDALAVVLAAIGVVAMARPWEAGGDAIGVLIGLGGGACWVAYILFGRRAAPGVAPAQSAVACIAVSAVVLAPAGIAVGGFPVDDATAVLTIVVCGSIGGGLAYWAEMFSLSRLDARAFSVLQACYPAIGVVVGFLLLSDRPQAIELLGVVCVSVAAATAVVRTPVSAGRARARGTA